ncbi:MAG: methyltransferase domain-containing protein [Chloroflexi bacterium]|nr:methyltransferase domain-containing protein [Chloroflexota bacterium]
MNQSDKSFTGSIPELYDNYLVPLIFEAYANDLADRAAAPAPKTVLETAAGTGVVTRALAPRLASGARYTVTDLNQPMLDHAAIKQGGDNRITWSQADALDLPFNDASFDAVVCQFAVMFFPDRVAGYAEALRVLKPGGSFIFNVWDHIEANEFAHVVTEAAASIFPDDPPRFLARTPHGYHDLDLIRDELGKAGFSQIVITTLEETSSAPSPRHVAVAYCQGTPLRNEIENRDASLLGQVTDRAAEAIAARFGDGPVAGKIRAHIVAAASTSSFP